MKKNREAVLALDCGTTGNRALVLDRDLNILGSAYREFRQYYPKPGWVEHDASEIWDSSARVVREALRRAGSPAIAAMGITNQRETIVIWDRSTGKPAHRAVVWQCRRSADLCGKLKARGLEKKLHQRTGLFLDPYFSGTKILWLLERYPALRKGLKSGRLVCGTIDAWVAWKLTAGASFATDPTNASRTLLMDLNESCWAPDLCALFGAIPQSLPQILPTSGVRGEVPGQLFGRPIPLAAVVGDQQSAAFAQGCSPAGVVKNTYGTGLFAVADTGEKKVLSDKLITTRAAVVGQQPSYALEGSVFVGGAAVQWLRDGLGIIRHSGQTEKLARSVRDSGGVYFVPALAGLGCPFWDPKARGLLIGLTRATTKAHVVRAVLESLAFRTSDVIGLFTGQAQIPVRRLRVDGGATKNNFLMQFQADILGCEVERPVHQETTALGAAALAGIAVGFWKNQKDFLSHTRVDRVFKPKMKKIVRERFLQSWRKALERSLNWLD